MAYACSFLEVKKKTCRPVIQSPFLPLDGYSYASSLADFNVSAYGAQEVTTGKKQGPDGQKLCQRQFIGAVGTILR
jgi:hypothetical protein